MRFAIFGGSFDPPHIGHLLAASDAHEQLQLDRVIFVPAANQPLKAGRANAAPAQRLAMVGAMVAGDPRFEVSTVELDRAGLSYTVDTLAHFAGLYPAAERYLLLGADVLASFHQWREPERVVELARPVLLVRADEDGPEAGVQSPGMPGVQLTRLPTRRVDVSSTEVRERVREGKSIRGFVPESVAALIARDGLYR